MSKADKRTQELTQAFDSHKSDLLLAIGRRVRDEVEAQDVAQDVFVEFVENYDVDQVFDSLRAWLLKVAQNKVLDRFRKRKTENNYRETTIYETPNEPSSVDGPDEEWTRNWLRAEIADAIELLPEEQHEVFVLHELEGKSFAEISVLTGRNVNTLLSQKRYALLFLRNHLKEVYDELE